MTACHIIAAADNRPIYGVTCFGGNLYVIRRPSKQKVQVYETIKFTEQAPVDVKDLGDDGDAWERGFTSCSQSSRLYISDFHKDTVYVVDVSQRPPEVSSWEVIKYHNGQKVDVGPSGLSVKDDGNLIVTCYRIDEIRVYKPEGDLIQIINPKIPNVIPSTMRMRPYHAVELPHNYFVVSRWDPSDLKGVCLVKTTDCEVSQPITQCESNVWLLGPRYLAVNREKSLIFLVDLQGIVAIKFVNGKLQTGHLMPMSADNDLREPWCLYLDEGGSRPRLYVGEKGTGRVFVFDDVDRVTILK